MRSYRFFTRIFLLILFENSSFGVVAQGKPGQVKFPEVDIRCPLFNLKNISYYTKDHASLDDFAGKWLVIDFWSKSCGSCIESFPRINTGMDKLKDQVNYMLVGYDDGTHQIQQLYARLRNKLKLQMPCAFDSKLFAKFDIWAVPYIIIIDPSGIVRGITSDLRTGVIAEFIQGKTPKLVRAFRAHEKSLISYDPEVPFLVNGNGGNDANFIFRSLLSKWNDSIPRFDRSSIQSNQAKFEILGINLFGLYECAFIGRANIGEHWAPDDSLYGVFYPRPLLEVRDSALFNFDAGIGKNLFCYSLTIPSENSDKRFMMRAMQSDLQTYFPYTAAIKTRELPCWKLVVIDEPKVRQSGKHPADFEQDLPGDGFVRNYKIKDLIRQLYYLSGQLEPPFIDETGITGKIDITFLNQPNNINDIRQALNSSGLDLVLDKKAMKVIIIQDAKSEVSAETIDNK
jgi:thiol-disulfide isomerase/thioredoxin